MRYPTDPNTGATIYDQGMVEVEFESVVEPGEEVAEAATGSGYRLSDQTQSDDCRNKKQHADALPD